MIVYLFNHYFPDASGFGRRCEREILALSKIDDVIVVCRSSDNDSKDFFFQGNHKIQLIRYSAHSEIVKRPENYTSNGFYEFKRNADINLAQAKILMKVFSENKGKKIQLYCVTSPLTVPLVAWFISLFYGVEARVVAFHDLEPELAMHMKHLRSNNWLVKFEFWLESFVCHRYKKVVVTSQGQAEELEKRTGISSRKIEFIPNTTDLLKVSRSDENVVLPPFTKNDFVLVYLSTMSFGYTVDGFLDFLTVLASRKAELKSFKLFVIGSGEGLALVEAFISKNSLSDIVYCLGHVKNPTAILKKADAAIIPWKQDIMTLRMLPTKLFEYLSMGIPIVAPDFGEFSKVLKNQKTALLYSSENELFDKVLQLQKDEKLRSTLGQAGEALYTLKYKPEILDQKFLAFYQRS